MRSSPPPVRTFRVRRGGGFSLNLGMSPILIIIGINLLLLIVTSISRDVLINLGLIPALFWERPWTIITNMFVHAGFWHLFANMITLYFFGRAVSGLVGENKFLLVYFAGGIIGNLLYIWLGNPISIAVGASGAVYAIAGTLVMMRPKLRVLLYFFIPMPLWLVVLGFMVIWSFMPGVAWQAHFGGLLIGLIAGYLFRNRGRYYSFR